MVNCTHGLRRQTIVQSILHGIFAGRYHSGQRLVVQKLADEFGVKYVGHGWNTALGVAADLQLAAALPHVDLVEFIGGSAYVDGLLTAPFALDDEGYIEIPAGPGLGVHLDPSKVSRYSPNASALILS